MELTSVDRTSVISEEGKAPKLVVKTPGGDITVESVGDTPYPDASIFINGHCIGFVEWHPDSEQFNFHYFGTSSDEPIQSFENITGL